MASSSRISGWPLMMTYILIMTSAVYSRHADLDSHSAGLRRRSSGKEVVERQLPRTHLRLHSKPTRFVHSKESESLTLECEAGGTPLPVIHWLKDGRLIPQSEWSVEHTWGHDDTASDEVNDQKLTLSSARSRLFLDCVSQEDAGEYACVAENLYHRTSAFTELSVDPSEDSGQDPCPDRKELGQSPRIYMWTKTMLENIGQDVRLLCRADGYPRPNISWRGPQDESLTTDAHKYQIQANGDLIIQDLKWSDMGNYICIAENIHGTDRTESFLYPATPERRR